MRKFRLDLGDAIRAYLEPQLDAEQELFIDVEQLGGGDDIEQRLARALCESVCMLLIYTPKYEAHDFTRREFAAMQLIEQERGRWYPLPSHLVIPVILAPHPLRLPPEIARYSFYVDFTDYNLATRNIAANRRFIPRVLSIVERIAQHYQHLKKHTPAQHDCNQFRLPTVIPQWRATPPLIQP
ncbi:toll/interleukin-1 receptor domain-containing protein [Massilia sp. TS11]|uniref:toll/interleukin-1 receptor domain-containing protein n=1 Tax=Massilia sp. TS11 TaxID=2908003 RepID=UPI0027D98DA5|nr:toll/interleukin-1 receptor domain-containing protein [Massilia sp. TS11]